MEPRQLQPVGPPPPAGNTWFKRFRVPIAAGVALILGILIGLSASSLFGGDGGSSSACTRADGLQAKVQKGVARSGVQYDPYKTYSTAADQSNYAALVSQLNTATALCGK